MPSLEKRVRRRRRGYGVLPALIALLVCVAAVMVFILVNSDPLGSVDENRLPFAYPENPSFVDQKNATVAPLVLGSDHTPEPTAPAQATPTPSPVPVQEAAPEADANANRLIPPVRKGDYYLPVFDRALRTPDDKMMIAVTIDDCNNADVMSLIMDVAKRYDCRFTLFPTGEALMTEGMTAGFRTCVNKLGFQLENHSFGHKAEYRLTSSELAIQLWKQTIAASYAIGRDYQQSFYRPYNKNSAYDQRTHFYASKLGYKGIASYTHSYKEFKTIDAIVDSIENGNIYQFDMSEESVALFELFVAEASRKGYELVTMNELFDLPENEIGGSLTIDEQTLITMEDYVPTYYDLRLNDRTNAVYALQARLMLLGYLTANADGTPVKADGIYGSATSIAVSEFQARVGIMATGNADVATQEALFAEDAPMK